MRQILYELTEATRIAVDQMTHNKLRSGLTALGVVIGILAVTLMGTAINGIDKGFDNSLNMLGRDVLYVSKFPWSGNVEWWRYRNRPDLEIAEGVRLNDLIQDSGAEHLRVAVPVAGNLYNVRAGENVVEAVMNFGTNHEFPLVSPADFAEGRFFNEAEYRSSSAVAVLGFDVAKNLFPNGSALGQKIRVETETMTVVGVFARQGSFLGLFSFDNQIVAPVGMVRRYYGGGGRNSIRVKMREGSQIEQAEEELIGLMRQVRRIEPGKENNFEVIRADSFQETLGPIKSGIAMAGLFITGLSLFVGAIGIMNITFVSVKERTKEIGTRRALGARRRTILLQFLVEAVGICLLGGIVGVLLATGLLEALKVGVPDLPVTVSTGLVLSGLIVSVATGLFSGLAPAWTAARLDPATALRHE